MTPFLLAMNKIALENGDGLLTEFTKHHAKNLRNAAARPTRELLPETATTRRRDEDQQWQV